MPDVGILNLQIHDDSAKAADGLSKLVTKLEEMKDATSKIRLGTVATGIKRINDELSKVQPSAIYKLKQLADVLEKIGSISGNVGGIRISFGGKGQSAEEISASMQAARDAVAQTTAGFEQIGQRVQEDVQGAEAFANTMGRVNEIVQQTGWTAQATAEQFAQMFQVMNSIRMSGALGGGASPFALGDGTGGSGADWTYWKDGAIEVEGYVDDISTSMNRLEGSVDGVSAKLYSSTSESVGSTMEQIKMLAMQYEAEIGRLYGLMFDETGATRVDADIEGLSRQIDDYDNKISELAEKYKELESISEMSDMAEPFAQTSEAVNEVRESFERTTSAVQDYNEAIEFARKWNASGASASAYKGQEAADIEYVNNLIQSASQADLLAIRIDALRDKLYQMAGSGKYTGDQIARMVSQIQSLQAKLDGLGYTADDVKKSFSEIMLGSNGLSGAFKRMFPTIAGLLSRFKQLVKYRMLRAVIREIADGFREGTENYYRYSQAIGGEFATKMDNAATALLQMKNSIGAAAAPLINSLIPYLQMAVDWFINIINYANQFVALLRGQATWSRAVPKTTKAFDDQTKAAKKAGAAVKDLLADWDELNIIQSESGGGSGIAGTSAAEDYLNMFEEVGKYEDWIKNLVDGIKDQFGDIWGLVKGIGIAILGWKFGTAFTGILGALGGLAASGMLVGLVFDVSTIFTNQYMRTGDIGWVVADLLTTMVGGVLMKKVLSKVLGGSLASVAIPLTFAVSAAASLIAFVKEKDVSALSEDGILTAVNTAIKGGVATGAALFKLGGYTLSSSALAGVGGALFTFGAAIGIKTIADTIENGNITLDTIKGNITSATFVGAGLALTEVALGGSAMTAITVAGGGAILTLGALFAIEAIIAAQPARISWGDQKATREEIQEFIDKELFGDRISTDVAENLAEEVKKKENELTVTLDSLKIDIRKLQMGLNTADALEDIEKQVFGENKDGSGGLLGTFKETAKAKMILIETGMTIVPTGGVDDKDATKGLIDDTSKAWTMLTNHMDTLGTELSKHLSEAYKKNISAETKAMELKTISELTTMMANVSAAMTMGESWAKAQQKLNEGLSNLTQDSWDDIFDVIKEYQAGIIADYTKTYDDTTTQIAGLMFGLQQSMENELVMSGGVETAEYQAYKDEYDKIKAIYDSRVAGRKKAIEDAANDAMDEDTKKLIHDAFVSLLGLDSRNISFDFITGDVFDEESVAKAYRDTFLNADDTFTNTAKENIQGIITQAILQGFSPDDRGTIRAAINAGIVSLGDFMTEEMARGLADKLQIPKELRGQFNEWISEIFNGTDVNGGAKKAAEDVVEQVNEAVADGFSHAGPTQAEGNINLTETVAVTTEYESETSGLEDDPAIANAQATVDGIKDVVNETNTGNTLVLDDLKFDTTGAVTAAGNAAWAIEDMASRIRSAFQSLNGMSFSFNAGNQVLSGIISTVIPTIEQRASGGFVRSGDLVMANENGNFEMMGRMGHQPVVANNEQIVNGISQGVASANDGVESRLGTIENLLLRILQKEFTAKAVPSSAWGGHNARSQEAYDKVTG